MRGETIRLKAEELLKRCTAARSKAATVALVQRFVDTLNADKRKRVTPELRERVLTAHRAGKSVTEIVEIVDLSPPTIRKITRGATAPTPGA